MASTGSEFGVQLQITNALADKAQSISDVEAIRRYAQGLAARTDADSVDAQILVHAPCTAQSRVAL